MISYFILFLVFLMQPQFTCRLTIIVIIIARSARIFFLDIYLSIRPVGSPLGTRAARPPLSGSSMGSMPPPRGDAGAAPPKFVAEGAGGETRQCQEEWPRAIQGGVGQALAATGLLL